MFVELAHILIELFIRNRPQAYREHERLIYGDLLTRIIIPSS